MPSIFLYLYAVNPTYEMDEGDHLTDGVLKAVSPGGLTASRLAPRNVYDNTKVNNSSIYLVGFTLMLIATQNWN